MNPKAAPLVGKPVVDPSGVELGYVQEADERFLRIQDRGIFLGRRFVARVLDKVFVRERWSDLLQGMNVVDNLGEYVGVVRDTVEDGLNLQSLVLEDEEGVRVTVAVDSLQSIDEWIELRVAQSEVYGE